MELVGEVLISQMDCLFAALITLLKIKNKYQQKLKDQDVLKVAIIFGAGDKRLPFDLRNDQKKSPSRGLNE